MGFLRILLICILVYFFYSVIKAVFYLYKNAQKNINNQKKENIKKSKENGSIIELDKDDYKIE